MKLMDHVFLNFNNNMLRLRYSWILKKTSNQIWHLGLLYKLSELKFSISLINCLALLMSVIMQRCFLLVHCLSFTTCFGLRCSSLGGTCCTAMPFLHSVLVLEARGSAPYALVPSVMHFFMRSMPALSCGHLIDGHKQCNGIL
jgi:hypothetical protein